MTYDHKFRLKTENNQNISNYWSTIIYEYYKDGRLKSKTTTNQNTGTVLEKEEYTYNDAFGGHALTTKTIKGDTNSPDILTKTYLDKHGRVVKIGRMFNGIECSDTFVYDYVGNNIEEKQARAYDENWTDTWTARYKYDFAGRLIETRDINNNITTIEYDTFGRVTSKTDNKGNAAQTKYATTYTYDKLGRLITESIPFEVDGGNIKYYHQGKVTTYVYDGLGRLKSEAITGEPTISYTYDDYNNRKTMTVNGVTTNYTYDKNNRLVEERKIQGTTREITRYHYDNNGNQTIKVQEKIESASGQLPTFGIYILEESEKQDIVINTYNGFNQLKKVITGGTIAEYKYNADGLRLSKTINGTETRHIWDGQNMVLELNGSTVTAKYVRGINLIYSEVSGIQKYYLFNGHGDVVQLTNNTGNVVKQYDYDAFGVEKNLDENDTNPYRYCGEYFDKETGTYYLRARYYNPRIGRFTAEDPIRAGLNWYVYCGNNPIMFIDPSGLDYIIAWSYSNADIRDFNKWLFKNKHSDTLMTGTGNWTDAHWAEFESRDAFSRAAQTRREELIKMGIPENEIHFRMIDSREDLERIWAEWADIAIVEGLDFYSHVNDVRGGSGDFWDNATKLNWGSTLREVTINGKKTAYINSPYAAFHGCYTATGSFAQNFANSQRVTTYGNVGVANFSHSANWRLPWHRINPHAKTLGVYLGSYDWKGARIPMTVFTPQ